MVMQRLMAQSQRPPSHFYLFIHSAHKPAVRTYPWWALVMGGWTELPSTSLQERHMDHWTGKEIGRANGCSTCVCKGIRLEPLWVSTLSGFPHEDEIVNSCFRGVDSAGLTGSWK